MNDFSFTAIDRRIKKRLPLWAMISVREILEDEMNSTMNNSNETFASCVDISHDGMFLETFEKYGKGSILDLNINTPSEDGSEHYRFLTKVMHSSKLKKENTRGVGVKFINKSKDIERLINA